MSEAGAAELQKNGRFGHVTRLWEEENNLSECRTPHNSEARMELILKMNTLNHVPAQNSANHREKRLFCKVFQEFDAFLLLHTLLLALRFVIKGLHYFKLFHLKVWECKGMRSDGTQLKVWVPSLGTKVWVPFFLQLFSGSHSHTWGPIPPGWLGVVSASHLLFLSPNFPSSLPPPPDAFIAVTPIKRWNWKYRW